MSQRNTFLFLVVVTILSLLIPIAFNFWQSAEERNESREINNWKWNDKWQERNFMNIQPVTPEKPKSPPVFTQIVATSYSDAIQKSQSSKKDVMIFFSADWCGWCKKMKETTMVDSKVSEALKKYVLLYLNTDADAETARKYSVSVLPTFTIINSKEETLKTDSGYKDVSQFLMFLGDAKN